jgi:hypothetical protein
MRVRLLVFSLFLTAAGTSPAAAQQPASLAGHWSAQPVVSVRSRPPGGGYQFTRNPVVIDLRVAEDGRVEGTVGGATLVDGALRRNRGWLGRMLHVKTDFIIRGRLEGPIFPGDTIREKRISAPFDLREGAMHGSLFHLVGIDLYPLVSDLDLRRTPAFVMLGTDRGTSTVQSEASLPSRALRGCPGSTAIR